MPIQLSGEKEKKKQCRRTLTYDKAIIIIQKYCRGFLVRKNRQRLQQDLKEQKRKFFRKYIRLCAIMIQKHVRGFITRKKDVLTQLRENAKKEAIVNEQKERVNRGLNIFLSYVKGWKIRRIFRCQKLEDLKLKIYDLQRFLYDIKCKSNQMQRRESLKKQTQLNRQITDLKKELISQLKTLYNDGC